ncbi:MAG: DUF4340 domain-containing protein [Oscillospiraceae bacterium]|nr:DUF4340 domain-containing protein [Oscillospiraceae bacterium]
MSKMSKRTKTLLFSLVGLAVLGGVLAALLYTAPETEESSSAPDSTVSLLSKSADDLVSLTVKNESGSIDFVRSGDDFSVVSLEDIPLNNPRVQNTTRGLVAMVASQTAEENASNLSKYGLDAPWASAAAVYADGSTFEVKLGSDAAGVDGIYAMVSGDQNVYVLPTSYRTTFSYSLTDYVKMIITPEVDSSKTLVDTLRLSGSSYAQPIELKVVDDEEDLASSFGVVSHMITAPKHSEMDIDRGAAMMASLFAMSGNAVAEVNFDDATYEAYGFSEPFAKAEVSYQTDEAEGLKNLTITVAKGEDGTLYAVVDDIKVIYVVDEEEWMTTSYADIVSGLFFLPYINEVSKVTVSWPGESYEFSISTKTTTNDNGTEVSENTIRFGGDTLDTDKFKLFYRLLISATNDGGFVEGVEPEGTPVLSIRYDYSAGGEPDVLSFYEGPTRKVYVSKNGTIDFTMKSSFVDKVKAACPVMAENGEVDPDWN